MAEAGIYPLTIAYVLGQANITMTAFYAHTTQQSKRAAVAVLEGKTKKLSHKDGQPKSSPLLSNRGVNG
jgi:hypothetical protein